MRRAVQTSAWVLGGLLALALILLAGVLLLTRTPWGQERVRLYVVNLVEDRIHPDAEVRIGRLTGPGLLAAATLHDVSIVDDLGRPFLTADSLVLHYNWRTLVLGDIVFRRVDAFRPTVIFERLPVDTVWNIHRIFPDHVPPVERRLIRFDRVAVHDGRVTIRFPSEPDPGEMSAGREIISSAPGGPVRELRFEDVNARMPRVVWESPHEIGQLFRVASLSTRGFIWTDPFDLRDMEGTVTIRDSVISFDVDRFALPASQGAAVGRVVTRPDRDSLDIRIHGESVAMRDLQWLYPPLPEQGGGSLVFRIQTQQPVGTLWYASDAVVEAPGTALAGSFGIVTGDTLYFTRVSLRASPLDVALLEDVLPVDLPVAGLLVGTMVVDGPLSALDTRGDLRIEAAGEQPSTVRWSGRLDVARGRVGMEGMSAELQDLDLRLLAALLPDVRLAGRVSGELTAAGRSDTELRFTGALRHQLAGHADSWLTGTGSYRAARAGESAGQFDARLEAGPVSMHALAEMVPGLPSVVGELRGPVHLYGNMAELHMDGELDSPVGRVRFQGELDRTGPVPRYRAAGDFAGFETGRLGTGTPRLRIDGRFTSDGTGFELATLDANLDLEVDSALVGSVPLADARARLHIQDGLVRVRQLHASGPGMILEGSGEFGLAEDRAGTLALRVRADSLAALQPILFPELPLLPDLDRPAGIAGRATFDATMHGRFSDFAGQGVLVLDDVTYDMLTVAHAELRLDADRLGTGDPRVSGSGEVRGLDFRGRVVAEARLAGEYRPAGGEIMILALSPDERYEVDAGFRIADGRTAVTLRNLTLDAGRGEWRLSSPAELTLSAERLELSSLEVVRPDRDAGLRASGGLTWPWRAASADAIGFSVELRQVQLGDFLRLAWPEPVADALVDGRIEIGGTAARPLIDGELVMAGVRYQEIELDSLDAGFTYADRRLDGSLGAWIEGRRVLMAEGRAPLDLSIAADAPERRLDAPLALSLNVERLPAAIVASLVPELYDVEGRVDGTVLVDGTTLDPRLSGLIVLSDGAFTLRSTRARYRAVQGNFRLMGDRLVAIDASARGGSGSATVEGTIDFQPADDPVFALVLRAREFEALRRRDVEATASGELRLDGRYTRPVVVGTLRADRGTIFLDEVVRQHQILELDPFLFDVADASGLADQDALPPENTFLRNVRVVATLIAGRDFWLRSPEVNVELAGEVDLEYHRPEELRLAQPADVRMTGTLNVVRGTYRLYGRRFEIRDGSVEFIGTPGFDPGLAITAVYRTRTVHGEPLEIRGLLSGTLQDPRVRLTSDVEPPISESDLASYLIFGRPTYALAPGETRALGIATAGLGLGVRAVAPAFFGHAAAGIETFAQTFGFDFFAITTPTDEILAFEGAGLAGFLAGTQIELGRYLRDDLFVAYTQRLDPGAGHRAVGARFEWRFHPTWTAELFAEDRFARSPGFGLEQRAETRKIFGFFLFREWGY